MRENWKLVVVLSLLAGMFLLGWTVRGWHSNSVELAVERATQLSRDASAQSAAEAIAKISVTNTTVQAKVIERIRTETIYAECRHSPDTYDLILEAFK